MRMVSFKDSLLCHTDERKYSKDRTIISLFLGISGQSTFFVSTRIEVSHCKISFYSHKRLNYLR